MEMYYGSMHVGGIGNIYDTDKVCSSKKTKTMKKKKKKKIPSKKKTIKGGTVKRKKKIKKKNKKPQATGTKTSISSAESKTTEKQTHIEKLSNAVDFLSSPR